MIDQKQPDNMEQMYLNYLGSMIINDTRCAREIKTRIAMAKQHLTRRKFFSPANWT
jgi:hypothetical protein